MDKINGNQSDEEINFENPNFQKLKATLNLKTATNINNDNLKTELNQVINDESINKLEEDFNLEKLDEQIKNLEKKINKKCESNKLPKGWEKYEDDNGYYYWHIASGTIQRELPIENSDDENLNKNDSILYLEDDEEENESSKLLQPFNKINKEQSFIVYSLGSTDFDEQKLVAAETSSKAIQKCIIDLTTKGDNNAVRCYGSYGTKKLILKIENSCIKLYDIPTKKVLHHQPISSIKVWGINGNNDFAYVANTDSIINQKKIVKTDQLTNDNNSNDTTPQQSPLKTLQSKLRCHIFHCEEKLDNKSSEEFDNEAQMIANLLKEEVIKYKLSQNEENSIRDYDTLSASSSLDLSNFIEEPTRTVIANYLGKTLVDKPCGIDIINQSIEFVCSEKNDPIVCLIHISSSNIIIENTNTSENELECKLERLSFLGISQNNIKQSAFIIQNADDKFESHVFECRPNSASLCRFIQEACKLRYEKCLDAHKKRCDESVLIRNGNSKAAVLKGRLINAFSKIMMK